MLNRKNLADFRIGSFPIDDVERIIVGIGPVVFVDGKTDDIRWVVTLLNKGRSEVTECTVTAQLLKLLKLNSTWVNGKCIGQFHNLDEFEFQILPDSEKTIWRKGFESRERNIFTEHRTVENFVPYSLFNGLRGEERINVLLRQSAKVRFYVGRSPRFSKHLFDFTAPDKNSHLFKAIFQHPDKKHITIGAFKNRLLRDLDKREIAKFVSDDFGSRQLSICASKARVSHSNGFPVWPVMAIPHNQASMMKVVGHKGNLGLDDGERIRSINVFAVTEIIFDDFKPVMTELHEITPKSISSGEERRKVIKIKPEEYPLEPVVDVDEEGAAELDMLYDIEDTTNDEISGSTDIKIIRTTIKESDIPTGSLIAISGKLSERSSMTGSAGGDTDVGTSGFTGGDGVDSRITQEFEPVPEPVLDPLRPRLMDCDPQFLISQNSINYVPRNEIPKIFEFLVDGVLGASKIAKSNHDFRFYGDKGGLPNEQSIPLITLSGGLGDCALMPTSPSGLRRALVVEVQTTSGVTYYMDIERQAEKTESIGINCIMFPGRRTVSSSILAYMLEHRVFPSVSEGSWPSIQSHRGPFFQIVRKHVLYKKTKRIAGLKLIERQNQHELKVKNVANSSAN